MSVLTDDEKRELHEFQLTSLTAIQAEFRSSRNLRSLIEYTNQLFKIVLFPLNFFKYKREISEEHQTSYNKLMNILNEVHDEYFPDKEELEPVDLVLFMCGFEPVCAKQKPGIRPEDETQTEPMLKNTTQLHKDNFEKLQGMGIDFLGILSTFRPFNQHLESIQVFSSNQPYTVAISLSPGEYNNAKLNSIIKILFITKQEKNTEFYAEKNSMYMSKLKTGRVIKLFGLPQDVFTRIFSLSGGGRRTSRRKQTKSRNPRKRKSTKQHRGKSMKYRKS